MKAGEGKKSEVGSRKSEVSDTKTQSVAKSEGGSRTTNVSDRKENVRDLAERTTAFAVAAIRVSRGFGRDHASGVIVRQFVRSATSVGAHYREARRARSRAEFLSKLEVALQELDETSYWIEVADQSGLTSHAPGFAALRAETEELLAILAAATRTTKEAS